MEIQLLPLKQQVIENLSMMTYNISHAVMVDNEDFLLFVNGLLKQVNYALVGDEDNYEEDIEETED